MELHCDWKNSDCIETNEVNEDDQQQGPRRSKRNAAGIAKIWDKIEGEQGEYPQSSRTWIFATIRSK